MNINVHELESLVKLNGKVALHYLGVDFSFDLGMPHERRYFLRALFGVAYPQADIDTLLFRRFLRVGDRVLDAGANIGVTALEALECGATEVVCVEPEPTLIKRLEGLRLPGIKVIPCALGGEVGRARLFLSDLHNQGHSISNETLAMFPHIFGDRFVNVEVKTVSDALSGGFCDVWKLDIEGAEVDVLTGRLGALPRVIIAEIYGDKIDAVVDALGERYVANRAAIRSSGYSLTLLPPKAGDLCEEFERTSPMYVFVRNDFGE